jgi:quinol-cytochrome oxidoreductase complex cytochrome b subunit
MTRYLRSQFILRVFDEALRRHPSPSTLTYMWNFGIFSVLCLAFQIISGIFLAMHYVPTITEAFDSVEHIMRDVNNGWVMRYAHANGASAFFVVVYIHTFRGIYYGSFTYPRQSVWIIGGIILFIMIATAFLGYVLPWGQISLWGATVITNLVSAIPLIGGEVVAWLWGGFSVGQPTLNRFYSLHFTLPFIIAFFVGLHIIFLHRYGSTGPLGVKIVSDDSVFYPYFITKDILGVLIFLWFYVFIIFFSPNTLGHPDNYIPANPLVTPPHIVPEWYFLPFYAILRSIPDKLFGVLAMAFAIVCIIVLPFLHKPDIRSMQFRPISAILFFSFMFVSFLLGWIGAEPANYPYTFVGQLLSLIYFSYFLFLGQIVIAFEHLMWITDRSFEELFKKISNFSFFQFLFSIFTKDISFKRSLLFLTLLFLTFLFFF